MAESGNPAEAGPVTEATLLELIDGKTVGEFTIAAVALNLGTKLRNRLLDSNDLIPAWMAEGKVTSDGNTYSKV